MLFGKPHEEVSSLSLNFGGMILSFCVLEIFI